MQNKILIFLIVLLPGYASIALADEISVVDADTVWNLTLNNATNVNHLNEEPDVIVIKYADAISYQNLENATDVEHLEGEPGVMVVKYADAILYKPLEDNENIGRLIGDPKVIVIKYADARWQLDLVNGIFTPRTTYTISLKSGWNLISAPLNLTTWELGEEGVVGNPLNVTPKNSLTSIYQYNTTTGLFEKSDHFDDWGWWPATGSGSFTELEPGRGYWVMAKNDCDLTFTGTAPSDLDITLNKSWNLIGWYSMQEALLGEESAVGDPLNVTPKNSLTSIYRYNSSTSLFEKSDHFDAGGPLLALRALQL